MDDQRQVAPVRVGEVLVDKYRVERVIGQGGTGVVVAAQHLQLGKCVAVKFLLPHTSADGDMVARFLKEAQAAVAIESEHVARVIDVGTLENGAPYMVMEYLVGSDLSHLVRERGPLPIEEAVEYVLQACEAIAEAHVQGIVHRDLKPANLFLAQRKDGSSLIKVLDFGISKSAGLATPDTPVSVTATSAVMGSPVYMSPEQMRSSKNVDARTDIWAIGVTLYELLTGHPVYEANTLPTLCAMIASDPPPPMRSERPDVPDELEAVVFRCLAKSPAERFDDVGALATALLPFAPKGCRLSVDRVVRVIQGAGLSASALAATGCSESAPQRGFGATFAPWGRTMSGRRVGKGAVIGIAGAAVLVAVAVFFALMRSRTHSGVAASEQASVVSLVQGSVQPAPAASSAAVSPPVSGEFGAPSSSALAPTVTVKAPSVSAPTKRSSSGTAISAGSPGAPRMPPQTPPSSPPAYNPLDHL